MEQHITLYNTKSRSVETFIPKKEKEVGIYSCGPTVYHYAHIGNLRAYVVADTLRRMFVSHGYNVKHLINITDVGHLVGDGDIGDDKLEAGAKREGKTAWEVAKFYEESFMKDLASLNIPQEAYLFPRATEHIEEQINLIKILVEKGHTYTTSDGIYFDTSTFADYALLAKLNVEGLKSGARVEENKEKRNITDFALWKFSPKPTFWQNLFGTFSKRQMEWDSPWGVGFPGWHIECSAMSMKYLGSHFDIHTGGIDHIPVHHTNEIAQSECATGEPYANYWLHINFLNEKDGKMSKSKGEFLRLQTLTDEGISPLAYRYYLLTTHYRGEIAFSFEALRGAAAAYEKLALYAREHKTDVGAVHEGYKTGFLQALSNDLSTPQAIAVLWNMIKDDTLTHEDRYKTLLSFDEVLGLGLSNVKKEEIVITEALQKILDERKLAKENKDWPKADELRKQIEEKGYTVKDTKEGQELAKK